MKEDASRRSVPARPTSGEASHLPGKTDSESWRPVRLNSDEPSDKLQNQITWFLFVSLPLLLLFL
jgi:hypothetical protein